MLKRKLASKRGAPNTVQRIFGLPSSRIYPPDQLVGVEIEVEGHRLPSEGATSDTGLWHLVRDGSLRGEAGEFIFQHPLDRKGTVRALDALKKLFSDFNTTTDLGDRTSVHVHVNCQSLTMLQMYNIVFLYLIFEEILMQFCGESRVGNLFALRAKDAEGLLLRIEQCLQSPDNVSFEGDEIRYAALNLQSLHKFGSLEFRGMRGTVDKGEILNWVDILGALYDYGCAADSPVTYLSRFSEFGAEGFLREVFGDLRETLPVWPGWENEVMSDVRRLQPIIYGTDWSRLSNTKKRTLQVEFESLAMNAFRYRPTNVSLVEGTETRSIGRGEDPWGTGQMTLQRQPYIGTIGDLLTRLDLWQDSATWSTIANHFRDTLVQAMETPPSTLGRTVRTRLSMALTEDDVVSIRLYPAVNASPDREEVTHLFLTQENLPYCSDDTYRDFIMLLRQIALERNRLFGVNWSWFRENGLNCLTESEYQRVLEDRDEARRTLSASPRLCVGNGVAWFVADPPWGESLPPRSVTASWIGAQTSGNTHRVGVPSTSLKRLEEYIQPESPTFRGGCP